MQLCRPLALLSLLAASLSASGEPLAVVIRVGGTPLRIPLPEEFVRYDRKSEKVDQLASALVPPGNRLLAAFAEPADLGDVTNSTFPQLTRHLSVQTHRQFESVAFTREAFRELQNRIHAQLGALPSQAVSSLGVMESKAGAVLSSWVAAPIQLRLKLGAAVPLGVFSETPDSTCFAISLKYTTGGPALQEPIEAATIVTSCVVLLRERLLYLYATSAYFDEVDAVWAREQLKSWRDAVVAANAPGVTFPLTDLDEPDILPAQTGWNAHIAVALKNPWIVLGMAAAATLAALMIGRPNRKPS